MRFLIELFGSIVCITYLCIVFFMVLDLRLTKIGTQRSPFFYAPTFQGLLCNFKSVSPILCKVKRLQWLRQLHEYWGRKWAFPFLSLALFPFHLFQKSLSSSVLLRRKHRKLGGSVIVFNWKQKRVCFMRHTRFYDDEQNISEGRAPKHGAPFKEVARAISLLLPASPNTRLSARHSMPHLCVFGRP